MNPYDPPVSGVAKVREQLAEKLREQLAEFPDEYAIFPAPEALDTIEKPTLQLIRTRVERLAQAPLGAWMNTLTLIVAVPLGSPEDYLDEKLEEVIEALDNAGVSWFGADRDILARDNRTGEPIYTLTLNATSTRKDF